MRLLLPGLLGCCWLAAHDPISTKLTWTQEISRIVYKRCVSCHRDGGGAPMPLVTYEQARPWAKAIKEEILNRSMPPWGAVKGFGDFRDDPSLTQDEINRIAEWVEGRSPEGETAYLPSVPDVSGKPALPRGKRVQSLKGPVVLLGIRPMMTVRSSQVVLRGRDESVQPLLWLRGYRVGWNRTFVFRDPVVVPKGAVVESTPGIPLEFLVRKK
jgi:mono/diheme cytochrome c family protein